MTKIFASLFKSIGFYLKEFGLTFVAFIKKTFSSKKTIIGFAILMFFVLVAIFGPMIFPYDSNTNMKDKYLMPSLIHPFGTDWLGRDVFRQVIAGTSPVLQIAFLTALFTVVIGTVLGIISGYIGGLVDKIIMGITNIFLSVPSFPIYLLLAALMTLDDPISLSLVISVFSWAGLCRSIRVQVMSIKERDYIPHRI